MRGHGGKKLIAGMLGARLCAMRNYHFSSSPRRSIPHSLHGLCIASSNFINIVSVTIDTNVNIIINSLPEHLCVLHKQKNNTQSVEEMRRVMSM